MKKRQYLKDRILLCGESDGERFKRTFNIVKVIDQGAFTICYEAYHDGSGKGVLKEFYPEENCVPERSAQGQLVFDKQKYLDEYELFLLEEDEYLEPYKMLLEAKRSGADNELSTFIPAFEIYHGCDESGNIAGTVYIWSHEPKLETFDRICDDIHRHPETEPEHKLVTALSAISTLTKCVRSLHSAGLLHGDIKPSNFGFVKRGNETLTQTLSMFDINSVRAISGSMDFGMATKGYAEPEAGSERACNKTDIYAIGATLFNAMVVTPELKANGYLFDSDMYERLDELVDTSELILASEANSHPRLRNMLLIILKKCLCTRADRYERCEQLIDDLDKALYYALPSEFAKKTLSGEKWVLTDIDSSLDVNREKNSSLAIKYHLYEHPLYKCLGKDDKTLNVLIIGFGNYSQKFLDTCLQAGQLPDKKLAISIISDLREDFDIYLKERPALPEFYEIDGKIPDKGGEYGSVSFEEKKLARNDNAENVKFIHEYVWDLGEEHCPHYIFIALGDDALNSSAAEACRVAADALEQNCEICFVSEGMIAAYIKNCRPLYVNADIKTSSNYSDIERMALNTHLVWERNLNIDFKATKKEFKQKYYHDSCVSFVLSVKYKLYSMGIDIEKLDFEEAADRFLKKIKAADSKGLKNKLAWVEHKRWVTEKLCLGWTTYETCEACAFGETQDKKHRKHVCIVRSGPDQKLATNFFRENNYKKWDDATDKELSELDELDRMSVVLHRDYVKKAAAARSGDVVSGGALENAKALIENDGRALSAYQEWLACIKDIWVGDVGGVKLYKGLRDAFLKTAEGYDKDKRETIKGQVRVFETAFKPVLNSMEHKDWKEEDVAFIDNIPFILTYTENAYMVIPYATGNNTAVFGNVAAATIVNPRRILYPYIIDNQDDIDKLLDSVKYVVSYMGKKLLQAAVEFILVYNISEKERVTNAKKTLSAAGKGRIRQIKTIPFRKLKEGVAELLDYMRARGEYKSVFAVEQNDTPLSKVMQCAKGDNLAFYSFDINSMAFEPSRGCEMLKHIRKKPNLSVTDMTTFKLSSGKSSSKPEFYVDYELLWGKYSSNSGQWKGLCDALAKYDDADMLASFEKLKTGIFKTNTYRYIMPSACERGIARILNLLIKEKVAEPGSKVSSRTSDSCEAVIIDNHDNRKEYDKLFSRVYALMDADAIMVYLNPTNHYIYVKFDNLMVSGAAVENNIINSGILDFLDSNGYINNLMIGVGTVSFTYGTRKIKELMTKAGRILEVYVYHKLKASGKFDDIVSSFEIDWDGTEVKSELDCIVTKGFRSLFIECKAVKRIESDPYYKISTLSEKFGINATAVMIADTREMAKYDTTAGNITQRTRGNLLEILTIWKTEEIEKIDQTLLSVLDGTYIIKEE